MDAAVRRTCQICEAAAASRIQEEVAKQTQVNDLWLGNEVMGQEFAEMFKRCRYLLGIGFLPYCPDDFLAFCERMGIRGAYCTCLHIGVGA